jgi:hypothetical protein
MALAHQLQATGEMQLRLAITALLLAVPGVAAADSEPARSGFTIGLDVGVGVTAVNADGFEPRGGVGLAGLDAQLGGFVSRELAISARLAGTQLRDGEDTYFHGILGLVAQYWWSPRIFLGCGVGLAVFGVSSQTDRNSASDSTGDADDMPESIGGLGLEGRVGYEIWQGRASALQLAVEVLPAVYEGGTVTSTALQLAWQHY